MFQRVFGIALAICLVLSCVWAEDSEDAVVKWDYAAYTKLHNVDCKMSIDRGDAPTEFPCDFAGTKQIDTQGRKSVQVSIIIEFDRNRRRERHVATVTARQGRVNEFGQGDLRFSSYVD